MAEIPWLAVDGYGGRMIMEDEGIEFE